MNGGRGGEACGGADFAHAGRVAVGDDGRFDGLQDLELAGSEAVLICGAVGEFGDEIGFGAGFFGHGPRVEEVGREFKHLFEFSCIVSVGWGINDLSNRRSKKE